MTPYNPQTITTPTSVVYLEYEPYTLPPQSPGWTRFVCISDTHTRNFAVPDGDVLLHSGDLTNRGTLPEFKKTMEWLYTLPHKVKIIIAGNHDLTLHTDWYETAHKRWHGDLGKQLLNGPRAQEANLVYLQDSSQTFQIKPDGRTWSVYGSSWSPYFFGWAFNYPREEGEALVTRFPKSDILYVTVPFITPIRCKGEGEPPVVQNDRHRADDDDDEDLDVHLDEEAGAEAEAAVKDKGGETEEKGGEKDKDKKEETEGPEEMMGGQEEEAEVERTVFVNAATWPAGRGAWRGTHRVPFAGPGFQPMVVDLRD
ncbi:putative calcineurin-like phosphoesterase [Lyophyllum shimeji]|uniref:Calcineurin-like phosphoesterase n=1 Tax=Lyophyllum shimeji TaxID=47721 RepID=A0A9P3PXV9_LYOSH|nr:putative calcineurin-like phosphoesterase [Lyophyllum shimeji]